MALVITKQTVSADGGGSSKKKTAATTQTISPARQQAALGLQNRLQAEMRLQKNPPPVDVEKTRQMLNDTIRWQNYDTHHNYFFMTDGVDAPVFIQNERDVRAMQGALGVKIDGIWGPDTESAYRAKLASDRANWESALLRAYAQTTNAYNEEPAPTSRVQKPENLYATEKAKRWTGQKESNTASAAPRQYFYDGLRPSEGLMAEVVARAASKGAPAQAVQQPGNTPQNTGMRPSAATLLTQQQHERIMKGSVGQEVLGQLTRGMTPEQSNALLEQIRGNVPKVLPTNGQKQSDESITLDSINDLMESKTRRENSIDVYYRDAIRAVQNELEQYVLLLMQNGVGLEILKETGLPEFDSIVQQNTNPAMVRLSRNMGLIYAPANREFGAFEIHQAKQHIAALKAKIETLNMEYEADLGDLANQNPFSSLTPAETQQAIRTTKQYTSNNGQGVPGRGNLAGRKEWSTKYAWELEVLPLLEQWQDTLITSSTKEAWKEGFDYNSAAQALTDAIPAELKRTMVIKEGSISSDPRKRRAGGLEISEKALPPSWKNATREHVREAVKIVREQETNWGKQAAVCAGPSYDPLLPLANEKLERYKEMASTGRYSAEMIQSAWEAYASIPILLTEETLSNPFAIPCADVLSLRVVDAAGEKRVKAALEQIDEVLKNTNDVQIRVWAGQVRSALVSKLESSAVLSSLINEATMTLIDMPFSLSANQFDDYHKQFAYFGSIEAIQNANMGTFVATGELTSIISTIVSTPATIKGILTAASPMKELIKEIIKEITKEAGKHYGKEAVKQLMTSD